MTPEQLRESLLEFLRELVPALTYGPGDEDSALADLGLDSLDAAGFALKIEEVYGVSISDDQLEGLSTLNDYVAFIRAAKPD